MMTENPQQLETESKQYRTWTAAVSIDVNSWKHRQMYRTLDCYDYVPFMAFLLSNKISTATRQFTPNQGFLTLMCINTE